MNHISITKLEEILSDKIGKDGAENIIAFIEQKINEELDNKSPIRATKDSLQHTEFRLKGKIEESKVNIIWWMFAFWVTLLLLIIGLYLKN